MKKMVNGAKPQYKCGDKWPVRPHIQCQLEKSYIGMHYSNTKDGTVWWNGPKVLIDKEQAKVHT
jgi:hypothetical protein